jgi:ABC-type lipoprotein release transport system permease subunit
VVNEAFAREMWGEAPAVGRHFILDGALTEAVGVVENGKYHDLAEPPEPAVFLPLPQREESDFIVVVRSPRPPNDLETALRRTLRGIAPAAPLGLRSWPEALGFVLFPARAATVALGVMGLLAAMLAATGVFGMAAYSVSRRMKELGIRAALGANRLQVMGAAVGRPMALLGVGSALGLLAGMLAGRLLGRIVYRADPLDPLVLGGAVLTMALIGLAAAALPARRAAAADPARLLREE